MPSFLKTTPFSMHFYPKAKKQNQVTKLHDKCMTLTRRTLKGNQDQFTTDFFDEVDSYMDNQRKEERAMRRFLIDLFLMMRRQTRL